MTEALLGKFAGFEFPRIQTQLFFVLGWASRYWHTMFSLLLSMPPIHTESFGEDNFCPRIDVGVGVVSFSGLKLVVRT